MSAKVLSGNVFDLLPTIAPGSVDCCVTSPPYWMLRSYLPKGHPLKSLELGGEPTPGAYVANLVRVFALVRECLAEHGTVWINCGDTYASGGGADPGNSNKDNNRHGRDIRPGNPKKNGGASNRAVAVAPGIDAGNLCLIPWRLALALQDDGWIVRSVIVWHKPSAMPQSVSGWRWARCRVKVKGQRITEGLKAGVIGDGRKAIPNDRPSRQEGNEWQDCPGCAKCRPHGGYVLRRGSWRPTSSWEPILMLAKSSTYFADGEPVKTPPAAATVSRDQYTRVLDDADEQFAVRHDHETVCDGANLRDVWTIAAEPLREKHYAAFPSELVRRCLMAGVSAKGYCPTCGKPWVRVLEVNTSGERKVCPRDADAFDERLRGRDGLVSSGLHSQYLDRDTRTIGWRPSCSHADADPRPGLVLDPFCGSGRTGLTSQRLGFDFVGCELNQDYVDMARRILREDSPLFSEA